MSGRDKKKISNGVFRLSKSKIMAGMQCPKRLYLSVHQPVASPTDAATQATFNQGHAVGIEAQKTFANGVLVDAPYYAPDEALAQTASAIERGALTIYEAAFLHEEVLVRVDILHRASTSAAWQIIEVKSTTEVKQQHIQDVAIQTWVVRGAGLAVESASVMHLNNKFVFPSCGLLFSRVNVSEKISATMSLVPSLIKSLRARLADTQAPATDIGPHCSEPYGCEYQNHCWAERSIPDPSVFNLPGLASKRRWALYKQGVLKLSDERLDQEKFTATQMKMIDVFRGGKRAVNRKGIATDLQEWKYPLFFLDFETIGPALPRYIGTRPFQQLPFQFSCHFQMEPGGPIFHREYLHSENSDPRAALVTELISAIRSTGSVVAYNKGFEATCLSDLAEQVPEYRNQLLDIRERLVDPLPIVRAHVYDNAFLGSFSIKCVAPALLGESMSYDGMKVSNGTEAQVAYEQLISESLDPTAKAALRNAMLEYCRKDTLAMVNLVEWLRNVAKNSGQPAA